VIFPDPVENDRLRGRWEGVFKFIFAFSGLRGGWGACVNYAG